MGITPMKDDSEPHPPRTYPTPHVIATLLFAYSWMVPLVYLGKLVFGYELPEMTNEARYLVLGVGITSSIVRKYVGQEEFEGIINRQGTFHLTGIQTIAVVIITVGYPLALMWALNM